MQKRDTDELINVLRPLGLGETEAAIYEALLRLDKISIRSIESATGINRGTVHETLKSLVIYGLVTARNIGSREYYEPQPPEKLFDIIRDKRKELLRSQEIARELVPRLSAQSQREAGGPAVRYYENDEGVVTVLRDVLQTMRALDDPEYYVYSSRPLRHYLYRQFPNFTEERLREGIAVRVIAIGEGGDPVALSTRKWLPVSSDSASSYTIIYANKVAQISISSNDTPYAVVTEDAGVAAMQHLLFTQLWQSL